MAIKQFRARRKSTGGRYIASHKYKKLETGRLPALTKIDKRKNRIITARGSVKKQRLLTIDYANVVDPKTNKFQTLKILTVVENPANRHFIRRNIITKGCVIKTEKGNARVTSRPGQHGIVNAVLI